MFFNPIFARMKLSSIFYVALCLLLTGVSCAPKTIGTTSEATYREDLSKYQINYQDSLDALNGKEENVVDNPEKRPVYANIDPKNAITDSVDYFLSRAAAQRRETNQYQGVTIQVYSGFDRSKATEAKNKVYNILSSTEPRLVYEQPNYKVKIGRYTSRLEAQKDYAALKEHFPLVLVVPEKFKVVE